VNLETLTDGDFGVRVGESFRIRLASGELLGAILAEVTAHPYLPPLPDRRRGFSIVFESDRPGHLPQGIYPVEHDQMGTVELFLVPIGRRAGGMRYEAVFN
jgi:hypothetical protein